VNPKHFDANEFSVLADVRTGGMATVKKSTLKVTGQQYALKFIHGQVESARAAKSFDREVAALSNLDHPNIVSMLGVGTDGAHRFIVLEWLVETLRERSLALGPLTWTIFYTEIGRPLLLALEYAHGRDVAHRDLKPMNIMFSQTGVPKITDFGIATDLSEMQLGLTFAQSGSPPWTPPENDDGLFSKRRDLYSWAAICVASLTGRQDFASGTDLREAAQSIETDSLAGVLLRCLSERPDDRPGTASEVLWDLDDLYMSRLGEDSERFVGFELLTAAHEDLEELLPEEPDFERRIATFAEDILPSCEVAALPEGDIEIIGRTFCFRCSRSGQVPWLLIKSIRLPGNETPIDCRVAVRLRFVPRSSASISPEQSRSTVEFLVSVLQMLRAKKQEEQRRRDDERYMFMLQEVVAARIRALRDMPSLAYFDGHWESSEYVVRLDGDEPPEAGERRVIRFGGSVNVFDVVRTVGGYVHLRPIGASRGGLQAKGVLEVDTAAQRRALERQEEAVKAVWSEKTVLPTLKQLLLKPGDAQPPDLVDVQPPPAFSEDKFGVLRAALGNRQLLAVQGPPGTGKTTLITEIVRSYLKLNPSARILVAAQTHIAIDNIVVKLLEEPYFRERVVRIARAGDGKVAERVRDVTLQRCVAGWCSTAASRARQFTARRGRDFGLDSQDVERAIRLESLLWAIRRSGELEYKKRISSEAIADASKSASTTDSIQALETATAVAMTVVELEAEAKRVSEVADRVRGELRSLGSDGEYLASAPANELEESLKILLGDGPIWAQFRREMELQLTWLDLLGQLKQFEEPVLRSASVVAGTCVGLGSNDAFSSIAFDLCIIDEASKATPTEALIPMVRSDRFIIVGDPRQLPPFDSGPLNLDDFSDTETKQTLLDHLLQGLPAACSFQLTHQHRMCQGIGDLISKAFYGGVLVNRRPDTDRPNWMQKHFPKPVVWIDSGGTPQKRQGHSFVNLGEQSLVLQLLERLHRYASRAKATASISVIAAYAAQAYALEVLIQKSEFSSLSIEVATVDSFQGRETDVTIFTVTLSNDAGRMGFLRSANRLNVALSRPRDLLAIVGDQQFCYQLEGVSPFTRVIDHMEQHPQSCESRNVYQ